MPHTAEDKQRAITRLRRIKGQAEALERAVEAGSDCAPILQQLAAMRGAVHGLMADLLALLDSGHLAGATLDVFRTEPLPAGHAFWNHPRITITPHTSARTLREESIAQIAGKIGALERGEAIAGIVDPARGY